MKCRVVLTLALVVYVSGYFEQLEITLKKLNYSPIIKDSLLNLTGIKIRKYNRTTQIIKGNFEIFVDVDNGAMLAAELYKKQGNEWRITPFRIPATPFCDYWSKESFISDEALPHTQLPPKTNCPALPKGNYTLDDFPVNGFQIPSFLTGEFRAIVKFLRQNQIVNDVSIEIEIERFG